MIIKQFEPVIVGLTGPICARSFKSKIAKRVTLGGAKHAWRNVSSEPMVNLIIATNRLGRFFQEAGRPETGSPQPVTPEDLARFAVICAKYGYWNATPEENAVVGIDLSF